MPDQTLAQLVRAKYPGAYDKLSDQQLEAAVSAKYPGTYDSVPRTPIATEPARTPGRPTGPATIGEVTKAAAAGQPQPNRPVIYAGGGGRGTGLDVRKSDDFARGIGASIPFAGIETPSNVQGYAGRLAGEAAQFAVPVGKAVSAAARLLPSAERAAKGFQEVMGAAKNIPIDISGPGNQALRILQLSERGNTMPKAVRDFLRRVTDPEKAGMVYEEARDFASSISRLSADEFNRLTPVMKREIGTLRVQLNNAVSQAAKAVGKGSQYEAAMKEYAQAAKAQKFKADLASAAKRYAIPGGIAYYAARKIGDLAGGVFGEGD